jgi:hypothetical protein
MLFFNGCDGPDCAYVGLSPFNPSHIVLWSPIPALFPRYVQSSRLLQLIPPHFDALQSP